MGLLEKAVACFDSPWMGHQSMARQLPVHAGSRHLTTIEGWKAEYKLWRKRRSHKCSNLVKAGALWQVAMHRSYQHKPNFDLYRRSFLGKLQQINILFPIGGENCSHETKKKQILFSGSTAHKLTGLMKTTLRLCQVSSLTN